MQPVVSTYSNHEQLLVATRAHLRALSLQYQDARRVLHDDRLGVFLEASVLAFGQAEACSAQDITISRLAALFYPLGVRMNARQPEQAARQAAQLWLKEEYPALSAEVDACLAAVFQNQAQQAPACLLQDALVACYTNDGSNNWANLRELEQALVNGSTDRVGQIQLLLQELQGIRYCTNAGRQQWQLLVGQQLLEQKKRLEKLLRDQTSVSSEQQESDLRFAKMEEDIPVRTPQTYFRVVYRNHINLSAIADNKANIMISVNSILISVLITFLSYRNIAETQPMVLLPVIVFLVTGLASLIFAVLSARPKVTRLNDDKSLAPASKRGLAFFGNFVQLPLADFESAMDEMLQNSHLLFSSLVEDLYYLGQVLDKKYRYLAISYNVFMGGLIATVILFLFTLLV